MEYREEQDLHLDGFTVGGRLSDFDKEIEKKL